MEEKKWRNVLEHLDDVNKQIISKIFHFSQKPNKQIAKAEFYKGMQFILYDKGCPI